MAPNGRIPRNPFHIAATMTTPKSLSRCKKVEEVDSSCESIMEPNTEASTLSLSSSIRGLDTAKRAMENISPKVRSRLLELADDGMTPRFGSVNCNNKEICSYLADQGVDMNTTVGNGIHFVHVAARFKSRNTISYIIDKVKTVVGTQGYVRQKECSREKTARAVTILGGFRKWGVFELCDARVGMLN